MRLDFNVLWVEDQQENVQDQKERLEMLLRKVGFRLKVQFVPSVEAATTYLADDVYGDHIDLILMDYNLEGGAKGDQGLVEVRSILPYKEIVFYSALDQTALLTLVREANVGGVYVAHRGELPDVANGIFSTLVKKVMDIDHARGLVMGATSDIDYYVNDGLIKLFDRFDEDQKQDLLKMAIARVDKIKERFAQNLEAIETLKHISALEDCYAIYTSADRLELLRKFLKYAQNFSEFDAPISSYINNTLPQRNALAHVCVVIDGFSRKLISKKKEEFTSEKMTELRQQLLTDYEHFERLSEQLSV